MKIKPTVGINEVSKKLSLEGLLDKDGKKCSFLLGTLDEAEDISNAVLLTVKLLRSQDVTFKFLNKEENPLSFIKEW